MASTRSTAGHLVLGLVALVIGLSLAIGLATPAPVAAAGPLQVSIGGTTVVHDFDVASYTVTVRNTGSAPLRNVFVQITHTSLPIDIYRVTPDSPFYCWIVDGLAAGGVKVNCNGYTLNPGQTARIYLAGGTTLAGSYRVRSFTAKAFVDYPASTTVDASDSLAVAVNP